MSEGFPFEDAGWGAGEIGGTLMRGHSKRGLLFAFALSYTSDTWAGAGWQDFEICRGLGGSSGWFCDTYYAILDFASGQGMLIFGLFVGLGVSVFLLAFGRRSAPRSRRSIPLRFRPRPPRRLPRR